MIPLACPQIAEALACKCPDALASGKALRVSTDSRDLRIGDLFFAIRGDRFDGHAFVADALNHGAAACICEKSQRPEVNLPEDLSQRVIWVESTVEALGKLAAYYRRQVLPPAVNVIAVTGSNGKTTTKCMIDHVFTGSLKGVSSPKSFNNHIGVPLTIFSADADDRYVVAEIGTNAKGEIANLAAIAAPNVAVITSIGEAHLEGLGDIDAIAAEKTSLLDHLMLSGLAVVNVDRLDILPHLEREIRGKIITVGARTWARLSVGQRTSTIRGSRFLLDGRFSIVLPIPGTHHATNAAAAFAVGRWFGLDPQQIISRLAEFAPPEGRTKCMDLDGVTVVDDTYNANPASMMAALDTLCCQQRGRRIFVMGDMKELGDSSARLHREVVEAAIETEVEVVVAVGPLMCEAAASLEGKNSECVIVRCDDADSAAMSINQILQVGDTILLKGSRAMELDRIVRNLEDQADNRIAVA